MVDRGDKLEYICHCEGAKRPRQSQDPYNFVQDNTKIASLRSQ